VKIPLPDLKLPLNAGGVAHSFERGGWQIFFAPCLDKKASGFNGVATYVRSPLPTVRADARPLGDEELDGLGRCLLTDHGPLVVFNVYVRATRARWRPHGFCGRRGLQGGLDGA
jgi:exonuclease III